MPASAGQLSSRPLGAISAQEMIGNRRMLADKYRIELIGYQEKLSADEWHFARVQDRLLGDLLPEDAFGQIGRAATLVLEQAEKVPAWYAFHFLLALARLSDTTELPPKLKDEWDRLHSHLQDLGLETGFSELRTWYRVSLDGA